MIKSVSIFEGDGYENLYPLALSRPVFDLRCGILTLREKITRPFPDLPVRLFCREALADLVKEQNPGLKVNEPPTEPTLFVDGSLVANPSFWRSLDTSKQAFYLNSGRVVAAVLDQANSARMAAMFGGAIKSGDFADIQTTELELKRITYPWDLLHLNAKEIVSDFHQLKNGASDHAEISPHAIVLNEENICIGAGSKIKAGAVLDAESGPIYIGEKATVMAHAVIEGPAYIGDRSLVKIGAKIYEGTSIGEVCKVGGEVEESIIHSYSNKQHDGFLGHAYLGQWVNLGADTNNSDLKNNYGSVKVSINGTAVDSGSQFVGLFMGDHSKAGINTMFNTGTVVGVMCNVFGAGFPPKFMPSFSWGGPEGLEEHNIEKALATARKVMARRNVEMTRNYENLFRQIFQLSANLRF